MKKQRIAPITVAAAILLGGCATTPGSGELASVRAMAEQAAADAADAKRMATEAEREAAAAKLAAGRAQSDAEAARAQSADTESKIDRMFKKAMYK